MDPTPPPPPRPATPGGGPERRRLAVIMFTDMVGYSALTQRDEALALQLLQEHRGIVRPVLAAHGGTEIKTIGDAFLVEFASAFAATSCAVEIQRALHQHNLAVPAGRQVQIRIGLHAGDVVYRENDVFGDGVNIAARIEPLAEAGGICLSEDVARQVQNKVGWQVARLGAGELKNISMPVAIYRVVLPWEKPRHRFSGRLRFLLAKKSTRRTLAAGVFAAAAVAAFWLRAPAAEPGAITRLAVLPLVSVGGNPNDEYFAEGLTEELISTLATIRDLSVIARTSVAKFRDERHDIRQIGAALNVGSVLEGSVRVAGNDARIIVSLVDVRTQKTLWSREFNQTLRDVFAVQSEIAMSVSDALKVQLLSGEKDLLERQMRMSSEASAEYLKGRTQLSRRTGPEIVQSIEHFTRALEQDPSFAPAAAGLAEAYTLVAVAGYGSMPRDQAVAQARKYALRSIALDDSLAEAHAALAYERFRIEWDWSGAEAEFTRALELKPGVAHTHELYGLFLAIRKRPAEALVRMTRAQELDLRSPSVNNGLGRILHFQRKYPEAIAQFKRTLAIDPDYAEAHFGLAMTYTVLRSYDEAAASFQTALRLSGNRPIIRAMQGLMQGMQGNPSEPRKVYGQMMAQPASSPPSAYNLGLLLIGAGDLDGAMQRFEQALAERDGTIIYLPIDPITEAIWSHPRFPDLVKKLGL